MQRRVSKGAIGGHKGERGEAKHISNCQISPKGQLMIDFLKINLHMETKQQLFSLPYY